MALITAAMTTAPVAPAMARGGDAIVGGIIGGIIGGAIANEAGKKKKVVKRAPSVSTGQRADNRKVQTALNYFGYNAGTPDGVMGKNSRRAISSFQLALGYPVTGQLTEFEHDFLLSSYERAQLGGANTLAMIAQDPQGASGLLISWRDELVNGGAGARMDGTLAGAAPVTPGDAAQGAVVASAPPVAAAPAPIAPTPIAPVQGGAQEAGMSGGTALPDFFSQGGAVEASLASHCNQVSLLTGTNGGYATLASMSDPDQALNEQFCLARTYAITSGEDLVAQIQGVSPTAVAEQCKAFGPVMAGPVAALGLKAPADVLAEAGTVIRGTGMAPAQLAGTARICLSVGYRTDDMAVATGSALILTALGEGPYAELLGHHLMRGFGTVANPALAKEWFQIGLDALDAGQPPVFAPGQPERTDLIRAVVFGQRPAPAPVPAASSGPKLPVLTPVAPAPADDATRSNGRRGSSTN
ncbi:peptidoglycan-binding domain-containing protein [Frigidibacter sp. ROC022]|uniref:peptidoglycan-binding domain-containing protein n=1 Tax=Frigidibacter sp. ROC022 TaxID=2971796 RepID=UPI00215A5931|nr:peptidoglycan-binding domain-containing protein [Frigidibacter sp. ROC022]MCR8723073.1 peptidoglycan-binding protein [Frigidibacter sp. ROC022]